jgi:hypothetical protein
MLPVWRQGLRHSGLDLRRQEELTRPDLDQGAASRIQAF